MLQTTQEFFLFVFWMKTDTLYIRVLQTEMMGRGWNMTRGEINKHGDGLNEMCGNWWREK